MVNYLSILTLYVANGRFRHVSRLMQQIEQLIFLKESEILVSIIQLADNTI